MLHRSSAHLTSSLLTGTCESYRRMVSASSSPQGVLSSRRPDSWRPVGGFYAVSCANPKTRACVTGAVMQLPLMGKNVAAPEATGPLNGANMPT